MKQCQHSNESMLRHRSWLKWLSCNVEAELPVPLLEPCRRTHESMAQGRQQIPLLERFRSHVESEETARKRKTESQRIRRARQARDEACRALPGMAHDTDNQFVAQRPRRPSDDSEGDDQTVASPRLDEGVSPEIIPSRPADSPSLANDATIELEMNFNKEHDLRMGYQTRLREAEVRISDLEQELSRAQASLNELLAQDQQEEIQRQQRIIANLRARLNEVEEERSLVRKQFRDSESRGWELESELHRLRFSAGTRKPKSPKLARQPGRLVPYLLT